MFILKNQTISRNSVVSVPLRYLKNKLHPPKETLVSLEADTLDFHSDLKFRLTRFFQGNIHTKIKNKIVNSEYFRWLNLHRIAIFVHVYSYYLADRRGGARSAGLTGG